jgi:hypothetical protein
LKEYSLIIFCLSVVTLHTIAMQTPFPTKEKTKKKEQKKRTLYTDPTYFHKYEKAKIKNKEKTNNRTYIIYNNILVQPLHPNPLLP